MCGSPEEDNRPHVSNVPRASAERNRRADLSVMSGMGLRRTLGGVHPMASREGTMPFSTELDAFLARVQIRIDAAMSEAREELREMAVEAEKDWSELRQRFSDACCDSPKQPERASPSQSETSTDKGGDHQPG